MVPSHCHLPWAWPSTVKLLRLLQVSLLHMTGVEPGREDRERGQERSGVEDSPPHFSCGAPQLSYTVALCEMGYNTHDAPCHQLSLGLAGRGPRVAPVLWVEGPVSSGDAVSRHGNRSNHLLQPTWTTLAGRVLLGDTAMGMP